MTQTLTIMDKATRSFERRVLLLIALVQFINIWDFMLVMPLGPDFTQALGIGLDDLGWIAGSYSLAAAIVGLIASRFLDRFDRRSVLLSCLMGMTLTTAAMVLAHNLWHMIGLRVLTGAFGGPLIASSMAIIADVFPDNRRGEAVGKVFGSFSLAAVLGVPLSLEIAHYFGWWAPFIAVSLVSVVTIAIIRIYLPAMRTHIDDRDTVTLSFSVIEGLRRYPAMRAACILMASTSFAGFLLIPNISAHVQQNMGYPRAWLGFLYFCGGGAAFFSMRLVGKQSDYLGYAKTCLIATLLLVVCVWLWFYINTPLIPAVIFFVMFMVAMSTRNVTGNALISKIPNANQRAGFMALMSAIQHLMSGAGATISTYFLYETGDGRLYGMGYLAILSVLTFMLMPWMMFKIERALLLRNH